MLLSLMRMLSLLRMLNLLRSVQMLFLSRLLLQLLLISVSRQPLRVEQMQVWSRGLWLDVSWLGQRG